MWAAQPPLALGFLAWLAPIPWLVIIRAERLPGRRPVLALYLAGLVFWLAAIQWLRLPHPAVVAGWLALSAYLACYLPIFVGISRTAVHPLRIPLWLAAPIAWTGLELCRAHLFSGFLLASLAHTQVRCPLVIQSSDLFGEYGVDFLIVLVAASLTSSWYPTWRPAALIPGALTLAAALSYGQWRLAELDRENHGHPVVPGPRIALIQGNSLADWKSDAAKQRQIMDEYIGLSHEALQRAKLRGDDRPVDLIVWPETMFRTGLTSFEPGYQLPPGTNQTVAEITSYGPADLARLVSQLGTPVLVGVDRIHILASDSLDSLNAPPRYLAYNSSVMVGGDGKIVDTYDKQHLVMFGEYVPFAKWLPSLSHLSPLTGKAEAGAKPVAFELNNVCYAPNICYETVIPHVIRRQVNTLHGQSRFPDVLVNLTNDAWYWGSSELDMHLACGVFRAVETRTPLVIAANGGISAWIDRFGRIRAQSPRQQADVILADIDRKVVSSLYVDLGDWFAGLCLFLCAVIGIAGWLARESNTQGWKEWKKMIPCR